MRISVVICTRNRASVLRQALQSVLECKKPEGLDSWEVIVVDNASSDDTPKLADEFRSRLPLRYVREEQPGLSNARNRGVQAARGEWILWIDDDVTVGAEWLQAYVAAIARFADANVLGGPIVIELEDDPPPWLSRGLEWVQDAYAGRAAAEFGDEFYSQGPKPYGANFGLCRAAALVVPFDKNLGRHPLRPTMSGEETEVIRELLRNGRGWWVPEAVVVHHIDGPRQTSDYLRRYFTSAGLMKARTWKDLPNEHRLRELARAMMRAGGYGMKYACLCLLEDNGHRALALRNAAWNWGYIKGCMATLTGMEERRQYE